MGRILFHTKQRTLRGFQGERHFLANYCTELTTSLLPDYVTVDDPIHNVINPSSYLTGLRREGRFADFLKTAVSVSSGTHDSPLIYRGKPVDCFLLRLNTAIQLGGEAMLFAARIHGQSEVYGYIERENRAWFAEWIERLLEMKFLRPLHGWEEITEFFKESDDGPVVMSYSVCRSFPNCVITGFVAEDDTEYVGLEDYEATPPDECWELGMKAIRDADDARLEIKPGDRFLFGEGITMLDILDEVRNSVAVTTT